MDQATHNKIVSFIWGIAEDALYGREPGGRTLTAVERFAVVGHPAG